MSAASYQNVYGSVPQVSNDNGDDNEMNEINGEVLSRPSFLHSVMANRTAALAAVAFVGVIALGTHSSNSPGAMKGNLDGVELWGKKHHKHHKHGHDDDVKKPEVPKVPELKEHQIPHYYNDQLVDHYAEDTTTWSNRYYTQGKFFKGPGSPLFVICGGEGPVDEVFYPFVYETMAEQFGAYVLQTEHRFYGTSIPTEAGEAALPTSDEFKQLLTPDQALKDFVRVIRHIQGEIGCSADRTSPDYCPVISVGASYPGFLSAMMRFVYPEVVDMSYAASAPLALYAQTRGTEVYFDWVTQTAETASPGCAHAYKSTLLNVHDAISSQSIKETAKELGICKNIPDYINSPEIFAGELTMMVGFSNADFNMDYHPPGDPRTDVIKGCKAFQQTDKTPMERMADWLIVKAESGATQKPGEPCYDLHWDIPSGANATITGSDWSGMGEGNVANTWEFQCCKDLIIETGFGPKSMFLERPFDIEWLTEHCQARFEVNPEPTRMVDNWHFDKMVEEGGSHILFTNGGQDAWSPLSHTEDLSDTLLALNFPSGAHHSDLNECFGCDKENDDIVQGRLDIARILGGWIDDVNALSER